MILLPAASAMLMMVQAPPPIPPAELPMFEAEPARFVKTETEAFCSGKKFRSSSSTSASGVIVSHIALGSRRATKYQLKELNVLLAGFKGQVLTRVSCNDITVQLDYFEANNLSKSGKYVGVIWTERRLVPIPKYN